VPWRLRKNWSLNVFHFSSLGIKMNADVVICLLPSEPNELDFTKMPTVCLVTLTVICGWEVCFLQIGELCMESTLVFSMSFDCANFRILAIWHYDLLLCTDCTFMLNRET